MCDVAMTFHTVAIRPHDITVNFFDLILMTAQAVLVDRVTVAYSELGADKPSRICVYAPRIADHNDGKYERQALQRVFFQKLFHRVNMFPLIGLLSTAGRVRLGSHICFLIRNHSVPPV